MVQSECVLGAAFYTLEQRGDHRRGSRQPWTGHAGWPRVKGTRSRFVEEHSATRRGKPAVPFRVLQHPEPRELHHTQRGHVRFGADAGVGDIYTTQRILDCWLDYSDIHKLATDSIRGEAYLLITANYCSKVEEIGSRVIQTEVDLTRTPMVSR